MNQGGARRACGDLDIVKPPSRCERSLCGFARSSTRLWGGVRGGVGSWVRQVDTLRAKTVPRCSVGDDADVSSLVQLQRILHVGNTAKSVGTRRLQHLGFAQAVCARASEAPKRTRHLLRRAAPWCRGLDPCTRRAPGDDGTMSCTKRRQRAVETFGKATWELGSDG